MMMKYGKAVQLEEKVPKQTKQKSLDYWTKV